MPVQGISFKMVFSDGLYAITESHILVGATNFSSAKPTCLQLLQARYAMMASPTTIVGAVLSRAEVFRDSFLIQPFEYAAFTPFPNLKTRLASGATVFPASDQPKSCLLLRGEAGSTNRKAIYLAGVPDEVIGEGNEAPPIDNLPGFHALFDQYVAILKTKGWGFPIRAGADQGVNYSPITDIGNFTPLVGMYIATAATATNFTIGQKVQITNQRQDNIAYQTLNGIWLIDDKQANTPAVGKVAYRLRGADSFDPSHATLLGQVRLSDHVAAAYTDVFLVGQTTRKRGNRVLVRPGKLHRVKRI